MQQQGWEFDYTTNKYIYVLFEQYSAIRIGPVVKRDVMKASAMLEHESQYATILAFDVKVSAFVVL